MIESTSVKEGYAETDQSMRTVKDIAADIAYKQETIKKLDDYIPKLYEEVSLSSTILRP